MSWNSEDCDVCGIPLGDIVGEEYDLGLCERCAQAVKYARQQQTYLEALGVEERKEES